MIVCPKCGKELADGTKFCSKCGTPLADVKPKAEEPKAEEPKAEAPKAEASKAETPNAEEPKTEAPKAEAPKAEEAKAEAPKAEAPKAEAPTAEEPKAEGEEKKPNTWIKYVCIGAAVVVFLFLVISLFSGKKGGKPYALYLKDKEIMYTNLKAKGAWQLTAKLSKDGDMDTESLTDRIDLFTECELSPDGKIMFFPNKLERNDGTTLYYRYINKPKKEPIKMDSSVEPITLIRQLRLLPISRPLEIFISTTSRRKRSPRSLLRLAFSKLARMAAGLYISRSPESCIPGTRRTARRWTVK